MRKKITSIFMSLKKSTEKTFSVFSVTNLIVFCKYKKQQNVTPATNLKNFWDRGKTRQR